VRCPDNIDSACPLTNSKWSAFDPAHYLQSQMTRWHLRGAQQQQARESRPVRGHTSSQRVPLVETREGECKHSSLSTD